eukprot:4282942-Amphidinium_carterae.2
MESYRWLALSSDERFLHFPYARHESLSANAQVFYELRRILDALFKRAVEMKSILKSEKEKWDRWMTDLGIGETYPLRLHASVCLRHSMGAL